MPVAIKSRELHNFAAIALYVPSQLENSAMQTQSNNAQAGAAEDKQNAILKERHSHWPYAADHARRNFDPEIIEAQAIHILARGLSSQRLLAFVGAGASMAYGRLTWNGLLSVLWDEFNAELEKKAARPPQASQVKGITNSLWPDKKSFLDAANNPIKIQILSELWRAIAADQSITEGGHKITEQGGLTNIKRQTKAYLQDYFGFLKNLAVQIQGKANPDAENLDEILRRLQAVAHKEKNTTEGNFGLKGVIRILSDKLASQTSGSSNQETAEHLNVDLNALLNLLAIALKNPSKGEDSPLRHLILDWGIHRFVTTNYDHEIERMLKELNFEKTDDPDGRFHSKEYQVYKFNAQSTGQAMCFATDGPKQNAAILHMHGDVDEPDSLVLTATDYQQLYLEEHPQRDLVQNTALAIFSANPVLFVGSNVDEDDVLRPMRQFMSGPGHRSHRLAVAIFPSLKSRNERHFQQIRLLLQYGVYVIFTGQASGVIGNGGTETTRKQNDQNEHWLYEYKKIQDDLEKELKKIENTWTDAATASSPAFNSAINKLKDLKNSCHIIEGVTCNKINNLGISEELDSLINTIKSINDFIKNGKQNNQDNSKEKQLLISKFGIILETVSCRIISNFVCAKLIALREKINQRQERQLSPPLPYSRQYAKPDEINLPEFAPVRIHFRHHVLCDFDESLRGNSVTERIDTRAVNSDSKNSTPYQKLARLIQNAKLPTGNCDRIKELPLAEYSGRRFFVISGARGVGKGSHFDDLVATKKRGAKLHYPNLMDLLPEIGYASQGCTHVVLHLNLAFSNEISTTVAQLIYVLDDFILSAQDDEQNLKYAKKVAEYHNDQLESLSFRLRKMVWLSHKRGSYTGRVLLAIGNGSVLFDHEGSPKNGQIKRLLFMLLSPIYSRAPLDILLYVGESEVPKFLRSQHLDPDPESYLAEQNNQLNLDQSSFDRRGGRRLARANIRNGLIVDPKGRHPLVYVHSLPETGIKDLIDSLFPKLSPLLESRNIQRGDYVGDAITENDLHELAIRTGRSRFAQTLVLAYIQANAKINTSDNSNRSKPASGILRRVLTALSGPPTSFAVLGSIGLVLELWSEKHTLGSESIEFNNIDIFSTRNPDSQLCNNIAQHFATNPSHYSWELALEILWHLSAFSHPIEPSVLVVCPRISEDLNRIIVKDEEFRKQIRPDPSSGDSSLSERELVIALVAMLELLVQWRLLFRVSKRPLPFVSSDVFQNRYAVHRHLQRHFLRLMGGRNLETSQWDQFGTTLYISQPDEAPSLYPKVQKALTDIVAELIRFPRVGKPERQLPSAATNMNPISMVDEANRIRAVFALLRSTFSVAALSHLSLHSMEDHSESASIGYMAHYRRIVRWTLHAAQYWEAEFEQLRKNNWNGYRKNKTLGVCQDMLIESGKTLSHVTGFDTQKDTQYREPMGIFYPGELVWLHNECGVISLAQGKLYDAEHMFALAEKAIGAIESDDSGSLHVRIRLHIAQVMIERGRPYRARQILQPISIRRHGHPMPPLVAKYLIGLLEHLGGNYQVAFDYYEQALAGLRLHERSRAAAFVLMRQASLVLVMGPDGLNKARAIADEAISLAQHGGHEDVRVLAMLARVRVNIDAQQPLANGLFEELSYAQRYATAMDMPRITCEVHELRARLLSMQGEYRLSAAEAGASLEIAALRGMKLFKARAMLTLAQIYQRRGDRSGALALVRTGKEVAHAAAYYSCVRGFKALEAEMMAPPPVFGHRAE